MMESNNLMIALVGFMIVLVALTLLTIVFTIITNQSHKASNKNTKKKEKGASLSHVAHNKEGQTDVAIAMALHLYLEDLHDEESYAITLNENSGSQWATPNLNN